MCSLGLEDGDSMSLTILTPIGALLAIGLVLPLLALRHIRRRARTTRAALGVAQPSRRSLVAPIAALVAGGLLLAVAATQPVFAWTRDRTVRTDAEAFVVLDVSRSMLAQKDLDSPQRIERAKEAAKELRRGLPDVRVGVASLTDRVLPHLFPSPDEKVFDATIDRSVGIERPPPRASFLTGATSLNALATMRGLRYFTPSSTARVAVVLTDGESEPVANARLGGLFRRDPAIGLVFVQFWSEDEKVFTRGAPEPQYAPAPGARATLDRLAASTDGAVYSENQLGAAGRKVRQDLGSGPTIVQGERAGKLALAPYLALVALLPFGFALWRRDR
jgi:VWA domain-containing protein